MTREDCFIADVICDGEHAKRVTVKRILSDNESAAWESFVDMELAARGMSHGSMGEYSARLSNYYGDIIASTVFVDGKRIA